MSVALVNSIHGYANTIICTVYNILLSVFVDLLYAVLYVELFRKGVTYSRTYTVRL